MAGFCDELQSSYLTIQCWPSFELCFECLISPFRTISQFPTRHTFVQTTPWLFQGSTSTCCSFGLFSRSSRRMTGWCVDLSRRTLSRVAAVFPLMALYAHSWAKSSSSSSSSSSNSGLHELDVPTTLDSPVHCMLCGATYGLGWRRLRRFLRQTCVGSAAKNLSKSFHHLFCSLLHWRGTPCSGTNALPTKGVEGERER